MPLLAVVDHRSTTCVIFGLETVYGAFSVNTDSYTPALADADMGAAKRRANFFSVDPYVNSAYERLSTTAEMTYVQWDSEFTQKSFTMP